MPTNPEQTEADLPATCARRREFGCPVALPQQKPSEDRYRRRTNDHLPQPPIDPRRRRDSNRSTSFPWFDRGTGRFWPRHCPASHLRSAALPPASPAEGGGPCPGWLLRDSCYALLDDTRVGRPKHVVGSIRSPSPALRSAVFAAHSLRSNFEALRLTGCVS